LKVRLHAAEAGGVAAESVYGYRARLKLKLHSAEAGGFAVVSRTVAYRLDGIFAPYSPL
jgi:hypothetical protein